MVQKRHTHIIYRQKKNINDKMSITNLEEDLIFEFLQQMISMRHLRKQPGCARKVGVEGVAKPVVSDGSRFQEPTSVQWNWPLTGAFEQRGQSVGCEDRLSSLVYP